MFRSKRVNIEEDERWNKFRASVAGMTPEKLTNKLNEQRELIRSLSSQGKDNKDPEYRDAFIQLDILAKAAWKMLGSRPFTSRMQKRG